jgi:hypothetical protein
MMPLGIGKVSKKRFFNVLNDISEEKPDGILNTRSNTEINNRFEKIDMFCEYLVTNHLSLILERLVVISRLHLRG